MGNYHVIGINAHYYTERFRDYRGRTRTVELTTAVCGVELNRANTNFCNISIAGPQWDYDWCHNCVRYFSDIWTDEAKKLWREKGIAMLSKEGSEPHDDAELGQLDILYQFVMTAP